MTTFTPEEIEEKIKELHQKIDGVWTCMVCDYISTKSTNVRKHVEKHMDGLSYSCELCSKEFRCISSLNNHKFHKKCTKFNFKFPGLAIH